MKHPYKKKERILISHPELRIAFGIFLLLFLGMLIYRSGKEGIEDIHFVDMSIWGPYFNSSSVFYIAMLLIGTLAIWTGWSDIRKQKTKFKR